MVESMTTDTTIQEIDHDIAKDKAFIEMAAALDRLKNNRDFKEVILDGYFNKEAVRLVLLKSDPQFQTPERQQSITAQIDAIGNLNQYFQVIYFAATQAAKAIESNEQMREELLAGEDK